MVGGMKYSLNGLSRDNRYIWVVHLFLTDLVLHIISELFFIRYLVNASNKSNQSHDKNKVSRC